MLQNIRTRKANETLAIDNKDFGIPKYEKPPSQFSGKGDGIRKNIGEHNVEFTKRKYQKDLDTFHDEAEKIEAGYIESRTLIESAREASPRHSGHGERVQQ